MEFEDVQKFWEGAPPGSVDAACKSDATLRFFDKFSVLEVIEGKLLKFDVEKIADMQDKVDKLPPMAGDDAVRKIFAPGSTRNISVRSHKLIAVIKDALTAMCESGELPAPVAGGGDGADSAAPSPEQAERPPPQQQQQQQLQQQVDFIQLAGDLPEGARINVRATPSTEGEVVGTIGEDDMVPLLHMDGDWACVNFGGSRAWAMTRMGDRALLVVMGKENQAVNQEQPPQAAPAAAKPMAMPQPQMAAAPVTPMRTAVRAKQFMPPDVGTMSPLAANEDLSRPVSLEEHNKLRFRVKQLEADMRALRLMMRSWSLDTPSAATGY